MNDAAPDPTEPQDDGSAVTRHPRRRLSATRVLVALALVAGLVLAGVTLVQGAVQRAATGAPAAWFAPYVDATLVPSFPFQDPTEGGARDTVLGFVVADHAGACTPTWGTYVDLDGAATSFDLDRRITRLRAAGGNPIVSFGGAANTELAVGCHTTDDLVGAYRAVIDRYQLTTVDLDIEGAALRDTDANRRRGEALARLQADARAAGHDLAVWLTLPVSPTGLTAEGVAAVDTTLAAGVDLAGVNAMIMDYGASRTPDQSMADANAAALRATQQQLDTSYRATGRVLEPAALWARIGATPMIGQNDTPTDRFTLDDADALLAFARVNGLGRLSLWSANRDAPCGSQMDARVVSNTCSGEPQQPLEFSQRLNALTGRPTGTTTATTDAATHTSGRVGVVDDADTSPYPIWQPAREYQADVKVVWHGNVYQAKWFAKGDVPDAAVEHLWDSPWRYLGPVLPTDRPAAKPDLPVGTYPTWATEATYVKGTRVLFQGAAYEAKWYTQGDRPDPDRPWETPWKPVTVDDAPLAAVAALAEWDGTTAYRTGDQVRFQGSAYEATRWTRADLPVVATAPVPGAAAPAWKTIEAAAVRPPATTTATTTERWSIHTATTDPVAAPTTTP